MVLYPNKLPESERVCFGICTSKHIDFFMLVGSLDFLRKEVKDWWKKLPAKYSSADEVAMAVFSIENADWSDDKETTEAMDMVHERF